MIKILVPLFLLCAGCVLNPKYSESETAFEEQARKNPLEDAEIKRQKRYYEEAQNINRAKPNPSNSYNVTQEKISGWSVGNPDAVIHMGSNNHKYHHKITVTLICGKESFSPNPYSYKKIKWKVSESISGEVQTSLRGEGHIHFTTDVGNYFHKITISTDKKSYNASLEGALLIELDQNECK